MKELILGMSIDDYHKHPSVSRSTLAAIDKARTPAHYIVDRQREKKTEALRFGHAFHTYLLEPDLYAKYAQPYSETKGTDTVKFLAAEEQLRGTPFFLVPVALEEKIKKMAESVLRNKNARALLDKRGQIEPSYFCDDEEFGVPIKARPDYFASNIVVDLKKTENSWKSAHEDDFWKHAVDFNYDVQVFMNFKAIEAVTGHQPDAFLFVVIEDDEPYGCNLIAASEELILSGKLKYERMMRKYLEFKDRVDCYSDDVKMMKIPDWYMTKLIGGTNG